MDLFNLNQTQVKFYWKDNLSDQKQKIENTREQQQYLTKHIWKQCAVNETWHRGFLADAKRFFRLCTCFSSA